MKFFKVIVNNLGLKIFAVVAALAIFFYASLERTYSKVVSIPVGFGNLDSSLVIARIEITNAQVVVETKGSNLLRLRFSKPVLQLNLSRIKLGMNRFLLKDGVLKIPNGIIVKDIKPDTVELVIDRLGKKRINLSVPLKGKPQKGFALVRVGVKDTVYLLGPQDEVALVTDLTTESYPLQNLNRTTDKRLKVILPSGRNFTSRPESVDVRIEIEPEAKKIFFDLKLRIARDPGIRATVKPTLVTVEVSGPETKINRLKPEEIQAALRIKDPKRGKYELPCEIILPEGVFLSRCDPTRFQVEVY